MRVLEAPRASSVTQSETLADIQLGIRMELFSESTSQSYASLIIGVNFDASSETISDTDASFRRALHFSSNSRTVANTIADFRVRTFKHDPKMYEKSERIFIYDRDENLKLILSDDGIPYKEGWITEQLNGQFVLKFEVFSDSPEVAKIENDGRVVTRNVDGTFAEFIIRNIEDVDDEEGTFKIVSAESSDYELIDEFLPSYTQASTNLRSALTAVLQGTRWSVGQVEGYAMQSVDLRNMSVKEAVVELLDIFNSEIRYRVETKGNRIVGRYIDVFSRRGNSFGKRFEDGKDVLSSNRVLDSVGIKTALYGRGASDENGVRLDFTQVEWSKANGDPVDKPLGQGWVGDNIALATWGTEGGRRHKFGYYDGQEEDPAELLLNTWYELQKITKLRETYEMDVIQLSEILEMDHERVRLGDSALVINRRINPPIEVDASIIEYRHNLNDRKLSEVSLGQFRSKFNMSERFLDIERDYGEKRGEWDKKPEAIVEDAKSEIGQYVDDAIDEAQRRIDEANETIAEATATLEQAMEDIEAGMIDLDDAMAAADTVFSTKINQPQNYVGHFTGDVGITGELHVAGTIIGGSGATIRGTLNANNLNLYSANIHNANIVNANITGSLNSVDGTFTGSLESVDGTFTGSLSSVDGTFTGDLVGARIYSQSTTFVGTDLSVTDNIYLGDIYDLNDKAIYFNNHNSIRNTGGFIDDYLYASTDRFYISGAYLGLSGMWGASHGSVYWHRNDNSRLKLKSESQSSISRHVELWMDPELGNFYMRRNNSNIHVFYSNGSKDGGSIEVDGNRYGMSPIDSPQTLIYDLITGMSVNGVTTVYLDDLFVKTISDYAVFASNPNVIVVEKGDGYFVVDGEGLVDFQVIGTRRGYEGTYFTDLTKQSEDMTEVVEDGS